MKEKLQQIIEKTESWKSQPLKVKPTDLRAQHCKTNKELELFKLSSSYQNFSGGSCNLEFETGISCGSTVLTPD